MIKPQKTDCGPEVIDATTGRPISNSRRRFLANSGMYTAGLVGSALLGACSDDDNVAIADESTNNNDNAVVINGPSDAAVLQYALNLEYLEAEFYLHALTGAGLQADDTGGGSKNPGKVIVPDNAKVDFSGEKTIGKYAAEIAADELDHVLFLRSALGQAGALVSSPEINLKSSFTAAAKAALGTAGITAPDGFEFNPFASPTAFLLGAFIFEDVGVTAYKGGARYIRNRDYLTAAAGILAVEAYHAGLVRTLLTERQDEIALSVNGMDLKVGTVVNAISDARDSLDGADDDDQGITGDQYDSVTIYGESYPANNIVPTNKYGIAYGRTPAEVHNIAYLTPKMVGPGMGDVPAVAFFPGGTRIPANPKLRNSADNTG